MDKIHGSAVVRPLPPFVEAVAAVSCQMAATAGVLAQPPVWLSTDTTATLSVPCPQGPITDSRTSSESLFAAQLVAGACYGPDVPSLTSDADIRSSSFFRGWESMIRLSSTAFNEALAERTIAARLGTQARFRVSAPFSYTLGTRIEGNRGPTTHLVGDLRLFTADRSLPVASFSLGGTGGSGCGVLPAGEYRLEVAGFGIDEHIPAQTSVVETTMAWAWLIIDRVQPVVYGDGPIVMACTGSDSVRLTGNTDHYGVYSYAWRHNGVPIDTSRNATAGTNNLLIFNVQPSDEGSYDCAIGNACVQTITPPTRLLVDPADVGAAGGLPARDGRKDNNDFVVFVDLFFARDTRADLGSAGGVLGFDGQFDSNDFVVFVDQFFTWCQ